MDLLLPYTMEDLCSDMLDIHLVLPTLNDDVIRISVFCLLPQTIVSRHLRSRSSSIRGKCLSASIPDTHAIQ